jgi:hypothetical protein
MPHCKQRVRGMRRAANFLVDLYKWLGLYTQKSCQLSMEHQLARPG